MEKDKPVKETTVANIDFYGWRICMSRYGYPDHMLSVLENLRKRVVQRKDSCLLDWKGAALVELYKDGIFQVHTPFAFDISYANPDHEYRVTPDGGVEELITNGND